MAAGPGRGIAIGGGFGGLLIVVVALFLGVDPELGDPPANRGSYADAGVEAPGFDLSQCKTGADANNIVRVPRGRDGQLGGRGVGAAAARATRRRTGQLFSGSVDTGCGPATSDVGPFYCPVDQTAYFDTDFFEVLVDQFGSSGGPLAQEYVVAHEFGHHVQDLQGIARPRAAGPAGRRRATACAPNCRPTATPASGRTTRPSPSRRAPTSPFLEPLSDKDIADALSAASSVGDDRIQKQATGRVNPESWTHGSSEQRQKWFTVGYQTGDPNKCDTFATRDLG